MPVDPPDSAALDQVSRHYGLDLSAADVASFEPVVDGLLAGRSVAIKDNTAVAGVPMMNGSSTVEGYLPARDATVVSRLLAAGATIAGKAVCEDLCFSGGSHTSRTGPVRNPWDTIISGRWPARSPTWRSR